MRRLYLIMLPVIFSAALFSCISNPSYFNKSDIDKKNQRIAVLPFIDYKYNDGNINNSGELVRNTFESKLIVRGFNVIEIEKTSSNIDYSILKKNEFPGKWIVETGSVIGADYMIYGSVHDYRNYESTTSFLYLFSWPESISIVGITARMVSCKTGELVWSGSFTRASYSYSDAASEAVDVLIRSIRRKSGKTE